MVRKMLTERYLLLAQKAVSIAVSYTHLTRRERWANWWDYNLKWVIIIGIAAAFVAYNFIGQYFFVTKPDYNAVSYTHLDVYKRQG